MGKEVTIFHRISRALIVRAFLYSDSSFVHLIPSLLWSHNFDSASGDRSIHFSSNSSHLALGSSSRCWFDEMVFVSRFLLVNGHSVYVVYICFSCFVLWLTCARHSSRCLVSLYFVLGYGMDRHLFAYSPALFWAREPPGSWSGCPLSAVNCIVILIRWITINLTTWFSERIRIYISLLAKYTAITLSP